jgi:hypothetical protein
MPSLKDPNVIVQPGPGLIPPGVVTASSLLFIPGGPGVLPTVWNNDLLGSTNTAQFINSISGHAGAGGTVALNISTLAQPLIAGPGTGASLTIAAQSITTGTGGNLILASGAGSTSAGFVQTHFGAAISWQFGLQVSVPTRSAIYANPGAPTMTNFVLTVANSGSPITVLNVPGAGGSIGFLQNGTTSLWGMGTMPAGPLIGNPTFWPSFGSSDADYALASDGTNLFVNATNGYVETQVFGTTTWQIGQLVGTPSSQAIYGNVTPSATNYVAVTDGTNLFLNAPTTGFVTLQYGGATTWQFSEYGGGAGTSAAWGNVSGFTLAGNNTPNTHNYIFFTNNALSPNFPFVAINAPTNDGTHLGSIQFSLQTGLATTQGLFSMTLIPSGPQAGYAAMYPPLVFTPATGYIMAVQSSTDLWLNAPVAGGLVNLSSLGTPLMAVGGGGIHAFPFVLSVSPGGGTYTLTTGQALFPKITIEGTIDSPTTIAFPNVEAVWIVDVSLLFTKLGGYLLFDVGPGDLTTYYAPVPYFPNYPSTSQSPFSSAPQSNLVVVSVGTTPNTTLTVTPNQVKPNVGASVSATNWHPPTTLAALAGISGVNWSLGGYPGGFGYDIGRGAWVEGLYSNNEQTFTTMVSYDGGVTWSTDSLRSTGGQFTFLLDLATGYPFAPTGDNFSQSSQVFLGTTSISNNASFVSITGGTGTASGGTFDAPAMTAPLGTVASITDNVASPSFAGYLGYYIDNNSGAYTGHLAVSTDAIGGTFNTFTVALSGAFASGTNNASKILSVSGLRSSAFTYVPAVLVAICGLSAGSDSSFIMSITVDAGGNPSPIVHSPTFLSTPAKIVGVAYDFVNHLWGIAVQGGFGGQPAVYAAKNIFDTTWTQVYGPGVTGPGTFTGAISGLAISDGVWIITNKYNFAGQQSTIFSGDVGTLGANATWHFAASTIPVSANSQGGLVSGGSHFLAASDTEVGISYQSGYGDQP